MSDQLVENGAAIAWGLVGVIALIGLGLIQLLRRRGDVKRARVAVRLASYSISDPRLGPIAVSGKYREASGDRWIDCKGQRITFDGQLEVVAGTRARWQRGTRSYALRNGDDVISIGVMSKPGDAWQLRASPGESGVQIFAVKPRPAPPPLFPWRAPLSLAVCGAVAYFGLYGIGTVLVDVSAEDTCLASSLVRFEIATALPEVRDQAVIRYRAALDHCRR
jgi:hypothetical protein